MKKKTMKLINELIFSLILGSLLLFTACSDDSDSDFTGEDNVQHVKVALVLPFSSSLKKERYERIVSLFSENLRAAMQKKRFQLDVEWYDEDTINIEETAKVLASRKDILSIIGLTRSNDTDVFAAACHKTQKQVLSITSSSETLLRRYSVSAGGSVNKPFLWMLSECDISKTEAILSKIVSIKTLYSKQTNLESKAKVALLATGDMYGQTFTQWVPFQISSAPEQLELVGNFRYETKHTRQRDYEVSQIPIAERNEAVNSLLASGADYAICALSSTADVLYTIEECNKRKVAGETIPKLFYDGHALSPELIASKQTEGIEGISIYADPTTGFLNAYKARYDELPSLGEPQLYDALLLSSLAAVWCIAHKKEGSGLFDNEHVQTALQKLTGSNSSENNTSHWNSSGMKSLISLLESGTESFNTKIIGATGPLLFDKDAWTSVVCTVYMHWILYEGKYIPIDYTSEKGSSRVSSITAAWKAQTEIIKLSDELSGKTASIEYGDLKDRQALIVAASANINNLLNYRHQADALNIYQLLKKNGYTDDKIILIIADDIANRTNGQVLSPEGENLYHDLEIDYKIDKLTAPDIQDILKGNVTENLTTAYTASYDERIGKSAPVLSGNENTNVFVFWSGHGSNNAGDSSSGYFVWSGKKSDDKNTRNFTTDMMKESLTAMYQKKSYRQLFLMVETCYALSVAQAMLTQTDGKEGIPGMISLMASNAQEESIADVYNPSLRTYMTNRFTRNVLEACNEDENISFSSLYESAAKATTGSHVQIINAPQFGALSENYPLDFLGNLNRTLSE